MINILKKVKNKKTKCKACKTVFTYDAEDIKTARTHYNYSLNCNYCYIICPICQNEVIISKQRL